VGEEKFIQRFGWGILGERNHSKDLDTYGKIILKYTLNKRDRRAQDRDKWLACVNMVMNLQVTQDTGKFLTPS
jgi:hypothetical protein